MSSNTIVAGQPTLLEQILAKPPRSWSEEEWKIVRSGIEEGSAIVTKWFPIAVPYVAPEDARTTPVNVYDQSERERICAIARFFRDHPGETFIHMVCTCKYCTTWCYDTSKAFTLM